MNQIFYDAVGNNPIIAAVKNMKDIEVSCTIEEIQVIFILFGDVCSIDRIVKRVKDAGKVAMVHVDLISGLSPKEVSVEYLKEHTEWHYINKAITDQESKRTWDVYDPQIFSVGFHGI